MSFDLSQLSPHPHLSRDSQPVGGVKGSKIALESNSAQIEQAIKSTALSMMNQLGEELQRAVQPLSSHTFSLDDHSQTGLSGSSGSVHIESVSSKKLRGLGQKKEGVDEQEERKLEGISDEVKEHLTSWKALGDQCDKLKRQLNEVKEKRNEIAIKKQKITTLIDQLNQTRTDLKNKLKKYEGSIFSSFYKNTIQTIKTQIQQLDHSEKRFKEKVTETSSHLSSLQNCIHSAEKEQSSQLREKLQSYQKLLEGLERNLEQKMNQSHDQIDRINPILTSIEENASRLLQHLRNALGLVQSGEALSPRSENQLVEVGNRMIETEHALNVNANQLEQMQLREERKSETIDQYEKIKNVTEGIIGKGFLTGIKQSLLSAIAMIFQRCLSSSAIEAQLAEEHDLDGDDSTSLNPETKKLLENSHLQLTDVSQHTPSTSVLSERYEIEGKFYGEESIRRESTLTQNKHYCENMLEALKQKLTQSREGDNTQIDNDICYYQNAISNADNVASKKDWIHSNYFRDLIRDSSSFKEAIEKYLSAPVNMRFQELKNEKGERVSGFYRVGVISDMRNGWVSLKELKEIQELKKNAGNSEEEITEVEKRIDAIEHRITKISQKHQKKKGKINSKQEESRDYALSQIVAFRENPNAIIHARRLVLQQQMIQLVIAQVGENREKIQEALQTGQFNMTHISLLNQHSQKLDKTGWMHDERIEMEDMAEIFAELKGKKLIFDGKGPSIDDELNMHMPAMEGIASGNEITLNSQFFNISVHGTGDNDAFQYEQNLKEITAMAEAGLISLEDESVQQLLSSEKLSYGEAEDFFVKLLETQKIALSIGCLRAKDRTGVIGARAMQRFLTKQLEAEGKKNIFEADIVSQHSLASKVVQENTGTPLIKINLYKVGEIKNISVIKIMGLGYRHLYQKLFARKLDD